MPVTNPPTKPRTESLAEIEAGLDPEVLAQLRTLSIVPGRPLLAVDADEVLVYLAEHLARYLPTIGFDIRLTQYQLEGSIFPAGSEFPQDKPRKTASDPKQGDGNREDLEFEFED